MYQWDVQHIADTKELAERLASYIGPGDVITLEGDLGAGKTTFVQFFAKALGIEDVVNSPTFTIMKQYEGNYPLYHLDAYRLEGSDEDLGWDEIFNDEAVVVVEWAQFIEHALPEERLSIHISYRGETARHITMKPIGTYYDRMCQELKR